MNYKISIALLFISELTLFACDNGKTPHEAIEYVPLNSITEIKYSKRFSISYYENFKKVEVRAPWPNSVDTLFYIITSDSEVERKFRNKKNTSVFHPRPESVVCFSTTHLPYLEMINESNSLTGFPTTDYIYSKHFRQRVEEGHIQDMGPSNEINFESLLSLNPDMIFAFSMGDDLSMIHKIETSGIPVALNADYLEDHPLGRAEWIKFIATFYNKDAEADSIFREIENTYIETRNTMSVLPGKPTVFTGVVYGDIWFMPGGNHYGARFFKDAGADYIWANNESTSILQLSFESVYDRAGNADFWIGTATYDTFQDIKNADIRYADFTAYTSGNIYNYSARMRPNGGNAYFESGYARPDIILKDLAKIFHPGQMEDHQFYYFKKLY